MAKRKLIVPLIVISFVLISLVATVALTFALTQQNISTTLNIYYKTVDIFGSVSANYTVGDETVDLIAYKGDTIQADNKLIFNGEDESDGRLEFPSSDMIPLSSTNDNLVLKYTFTNEGNNDYTAILDYNETEIKSENMIIEYSTTGAVDSYLDARLGIVVASGTERSYYIKISVDKKAKNASFVGEFSWLLENYEGSATDTIQLDALDYVEDSSTGTYAVTYNGMSLTDGSLYVPSTINSISVTGVVANSSLTDAQKQQVTEVVVADGVSSIGSEAFKGYTNLENVSIASSSDSASASVMSNATGLKSVGYEAFMGCSSLKEIYIPASVTTIETRAFNLCSALDIVKIEDINKWTQITFGDAYSSPVFYAKKLCNTNGQVITSVALSDSITTIKYNAFRNNASLTSIIIPSSVTTIEKYAFDGCEGLTSLSIPVSVTSIGRFAISRCFKLKNLEILGNATLDANAVKMSETSIENLILNCKTVPTDCAGSTTLKTLTLGENVKITDPYAFNACRNLTTVFIDGILEGGYTFQACSSLKEVTFGENCETIWFWQFVSCYSLEVVNFLGTPNFIASSAFQGADNIKKVNITDSDLLHAGWEGPIELLNNASLYLNGTLVTEVTIGIGYDSIGGIDFISGYKQLTKLTLTNTVTSIYTYGLVGLKEVYIPSSVKAIYAGAFKNVHATFYCEAAYKPEGWDADWAPNAKNIVWAYGVTHTCEYEEELNYYVANNKAYSYNRCANCGTKGNVTLLSDAVIVTPETAQSVLDSNINGKTIVFANGVYSEILDLRPSKNTATIYTANTDNPYVLGSQVTGDLDNSAVYNYVRNISNVTLIGADGAVFTNTLRISTQGNIVEPALTNIYDAVRGGYGFPRYIHMNIDGLTISNINFFGEYATLAMKNVNPYVSYANVTVQNNSFITDYLSTKDPFLQGENNATTNINAATIYYSLYNDSLTNFVYQNNYVDGHFQGVNIINANNAKFTNNKISNTKHNAIAVQNSDNMNFTGTIIIGNNTISSTSDMAIRFGVGKDAMIDILNNVFKNCTDDGSLLKTQNTASNCTYTFTNNSYNGSKLNDANGIITTGTQWEYVTE